MVDFLDSLRKLAGLQQLTNMSAPAQGPQMSTPVSPIEAPPGPSPYGNKRIGGYKFGGQQFGASAPPPAVEPSVEGSPVIGPSPYGNQRFGGNTFGGQTFGGETHGGNTFGGNTPQDIFAGIQRFLKTPLIDTPAPPQAPGVTVQATPPMPDIPLPQDTPPPVNGASRQGGYGDAPTPQAPALPAPQAVSDAPGVFQGLMQDAPQADTPAPSPLDSGPTSPSDTPAGRSLLERIMGSDDPSTKDRYGLTSGQRHANAFDALAKLGFTIMAAGMPQSPNQSAQIMAGMSTPGADLMRGRSAIMAQNAGAQQAEANETKLAGVRDARSVMQSPEFQEAYKNMPASMQAVARAAAATGDVRTIVDMMRPRAVRGGYVDGATGQFIPTAGTGTGAGGKVTEFQAKNAQYFTALDHSNGTLNKFEGEGSDLYNQVVDKYAPNIVSNYFKSDKASQYFNAQKVWAEQVLRLATGAAAPASEQEQYRTLWFPQPGESAASIASKRELRAKITDQIRQNAGNALGHGKASDHFDTSTGAFLGGSSGGQAAQPQPATGPEPDKYDYRRMPDGSLQQRLKK